MAIVADLVNPTGHLGVPKFSATQASITGTGGITTGLGTINTGGAVTSVANAATTVPTDTDAISSIVGGTVNVVVINHAAAANSIEAAAKNVNVLAVGF